MATDKRAAEQMFEDLLMSMSWHRTVREAYRNKGGTVGVERCERLLKLDYALIRTHCAEHDLELPHDVPPEAHPAVSDTE